MLEHKNGHSGSAGGGRKPTAKTSPVFSQFQTHLPWRLGEAIPYSPSMLCSKSAEMHAATCC